MFPDEVFNDRRELAEKIATASPDFLRDNSAALMRIIWELQASLALELQVIQGIKRLDPDDKTSVAEYREKFADYVERRDFNLERTSCGRIGRIYYEQILPLERAPGGPPRAAELHELLRGFSSADAEFTEQIEPFMSQALDVVTAMRDAADPTESAARQREFADSYRDEVQRLKDAIAKMSRVGDSLLEKL